MDSTSAGIGSGCTVGCAGPSAGVLDQGLLQGFALGGPTIWLRAASPDLALVIGAVTNPRGGDSCHGMVTCRQRHVGEPSAA